MNHRYPWNWSLGALLLLPWLSPLTAGPSPNVWPWLLSALCAVLLWLFRRRLNVELIAAGWLLAAAVSAVIGLVQYFGLAPSFSPWISQPQVGEAFANLRQRNQFATLTSIGLVALIGLLALREQPAQQQRMPGWAYLFALLLALGNAASSSRTGLLQWLLIALLAAWWVLPGRWRLMLFVAQTLLAYGLAVLALPWLLELATGVRSGGLFGRLVETAGCGSRKILWANVLTLIAEKPWRGWGWGELDYAHFMTLYPGARFCEILDNAHNLPLHLAVELGVPAALAICGALSWLVWRAQPWRETDPLRQMAWGVLAVILLHSLLEYPLWYGPFQIAAGLSVALLGSGLGARPAAGRGVDQEFVTAQVGGCASSLLLPLPLGEGRGEGSPMAIPVAVAKPAALTLALSQREREKELQTRTPEQLHKFKRKMPFAQYLQALAAITMIVILAGAAISYDRVSQIYLPPAERSAAYRDETLGKIRGSWFFHEQALFAELSMTVLTPGNAAAVHAMALELLHYSPESRVIEKLIESATMLGRDDEALRYLARFRAAFPQEHARWARENAAPSPKG